MPQAAVQTLRHKATYLRNHHLAYYLDHYLWLAAFFRPLADTPCFSLAVFWLHQTVLRPQL